MGASKHEETEILIGSTRGNPLWQTDVDRGAIEPQARGHAMDILLPKNTEIEKHSARSERCGSSRHARKPQAKSN